MKRKLAFAFIIIAIISVNSQGGNSQNIELGDLYFREMNYQKAINYYKLDSTIAEAQWKMARAYLSLAEISSIEERKEYAEAAKQAASSCIKINKAISYGHSMYAAALGVIAISEGTKSKVKLGTIIKKELDIAIALNSRDDLAYSLLGSFYRALGKVNWFERGVADSFFGGLPEGGFIEGEAAFKKAIEIAPDNMRHWEELGKLYKDWGKTEEAKEAFQHVLKLKPQVQGDFKKISRARAMLEELDE